LGAASFFEGYGFNIVIVALPQLRASYHLSQETASLWVALLYLGALPAVLLARKADRAGRRHLLLVSISGYTLATFATALAPSIATFATCQVIARFFLGVETVLVWTMIAEELPARARGFGFGFGWLAMLSAVGSGWSAILYGTILHPNGISWRVLYLAAVPVLTLVALLRRRLPESGRFLAASEHGRLASRWSEMLMPASSVPGQQDPASALNSSRPRCELWADRQEWFSLSWAIHELPAGRPADPGRRRPVSRRPRARTRTAGRRRPHRHSIPRDRRARTGSDHR